MPSKVSPENLKKKLLSTKIQELENLKIQKKIKNEIENIHKILSFRKNVNQTIQKPKRYTVKKPDSKKAWKSEGHVFGKQERPKAI